MVAETLPCSCQVRVRQVPQKGFALDPSKCSKKPEHPKEQDEDVDKEEDQDVRRRIRISRMMIRMKMTMTCRMMTMMIFEDTRHVQFGTRCIEILKDPSLTMILDSDAILQP